jgi:hypothetical protein
MSNWTESRLQRLFVRYNRRFWHGRLRGVRFCISPLERCYGEWLLKQREIRIDIDRHEGNDREIRSTLLHEMCHVAAGPDHNSKFWAEIERLLCRRAPIAVGFPETDGLQIVENAVPRRFLLARRLLNKVHRQQQRKLEAEARNSGREDLTLTEEDLLQEFADSDVASLRWKRALRLVGSKYGLLDIDGKPKDKRSARIISRARSIATLAANY